MKSLVSDDSCCVDCELCPDPQPGSTQSTHPAGQMISPHARGHQARKITLDPDTPGAEHRPHPAAPILGQTRAQKTITMMLAPPKAGPGLGTRSDQTHIA